MTAVDLAHGDLTGSQQGPEPHWHGFCARQHGLGLDPAAKFLVQAFDRVGGSRRFPLRRGTLLGAEPEVADVTEQGLG